MNTNNIADNFIIPPAHKICWLLFVMGVFIGYGSSVWRFLLNYVSLEISVLALSMSLLGGASVLAIYHTSRKCGSEGSGILASITMICLWGYAACPIKSTGFTTEWIKFNLQTPIFALGWLYLSNLTKYGKAKFYIGCSICLGLVFGLSNNLWWLILTIISSHLYRRLAFEEFLATSPSGEPYPIKLFLIRLIGCFKDKRLLKAIIIFIPTSVITSLIKNMLISNHIFNSLNEYLPADNPRWFNPLLKLQYFYILLFLPIMLFGLWLMAIKYRKGCFGLLISLFLAILFTPYRNFLASPEFICIFSISTGIGLDDFSDIIKRKFIVGLIAGIAISNIFVWLIAGKMYTIVAELALR